MLIICTSVSIREGGVGETTPSGEPPMNLTVSSVHTSPEKPAIHRYKNIYWLEESVGLRISLPVINSNSIKPILLAAV